MALKDAKELTMDEILASIRSILHESGSVRHAAAEDERYAVPPVFADNGRLPVSERPAAVRREPSGTEPVPAPEPQKVRDDADEDVAAICSNIQKLMQSPGDEKDVRFSISIDDEPLLSNPAAPEKAEPFASVFAGEEKNVSERREESFADERPSRPAESGDVSSEIIAGFAAVFAERRKQKPLLDQSVRELAESAVVNEVVPVLAQWLKDCLPAIIQKEIERVTVKAGKR